MAAANYTDFDQDLSGVLGQSLRFSLRSLEFSQSPLYWLGLGSFAFGPEVFNASLRFGQVPPR